MSRDAMKLALEAAEVLEKLFKQAEAMNEDMAAGVNVHCQITVADLSKGLYAAPVIREALAEQSAKEKAPQSANCEAPGWINSDHARRDDYTTEQPAQHRAWFTVDELNAWADKKLKENPQWEEQPVQQALDKMAENARELGLDYEPSAGTQVSKVWWDGEKLMAKPIPLDDFYEPARGTHEDSN